MPSEFQEMKCLALPKLNLQFLTMHDYLLRNLNLFRLESTYEIRQVRERSRKGLVINFFFWCCLNTRTLRARSRACALSATAQARRSLMAGQCRKQPSLPHTSTLLLFSFFSRFVSFVVGRAWRSQSLASRSSKWASRDWQRTGRPPSAPTSLFT